MLLPKKNDPFSRASHQLLPYEVNSIPIERMNSATLNSLIPPDFARVAVLRIFSARSQDRQRTLAPVRR